jgi:hypothetical protein
MNTYLEPLVDELLTLWVDGVDAYDANTQTDFKLYACYLWSIHDFPGYGVCSSLQNQGLKACPPCGPNVLESRKCPHLKKVIYIGHRKYVPLKHRYRLNRHKSKFDGVSYLRVSKPIRTSGKFWLKQWRKVAIERTLSLKDSGMKDKSIFFRLPYYKVSKILYQLVFII